MAGDAELGLYGAAFKIFEGAMILPSVLLSVTFPQLARAHGHPPIQRRLERQIGLLLLGFGLLAGATCFVGGTPLIRGVFGTGFGRAVPSLRVLALGMPLLFLNYGLTHFLVARDMGTMTQRFALAMLGLNLVLDLALIPRAHGPGAAWATVLTELALTGCCLGALRLTFASQSVLPSIPTAPRIGQKAV
jgi:O-antigen/teichoic acid export membrane protein